MRLRLFLTTFPLMFGLITIPTHSQVTLFPFQLPWDDSSPTLTDLSGLNEKPAGTSGHIRAGDDGHLYAGSRRVRFVGVNLTYRSGAPKHTDAGKIARRMAKFGINVVRFHLMDADWGGEVIFDPSKPGTRDLDPATLDKLDYFIAELKKNGIYSDINLLTGRNFSSSDGLDPAIDSMDWKAKQSPAMFDPAMIELQKEYATRLLSRVNPYTGLTYTEDPAIAFVEVVNEHGLMHAFHSRMIDRLPGYYQEQLRQQWNAFLHTRYASQADLEREWTIRSEAGPQMLVNPGFTAGLQGWNVEQHEVARVTASVVNQGPSGKPATQIRINTTSATGWHVQLNQGGLRVEPGVVYTLSFWGKADRNKTVSVQVEMAHDPWQGLGFDRSVPLTTSWKRFEFQFILGTGDGNARLNFRGLGDQLRTYWFADFSLARGGTIGLSAGEDLERRTILLFLKDTIAERTAGAQEDWMEFLWKTEESFWKQMRSHLKETLGVKALLIGTIIGNSTPNLMHLFDVIDSHAYWQHPQFEVSWGSPWWIHNASMIGHNTGGTLTDLAMKRVAGKPFSVSEYNHPFPLSFGAETFVTLAAFASLQDWDAIFGYTYSDGKLEWPIDEITGYFDLQRSPERMISLLHGALLFRRFDVEAARQTVVGNLTVEEEIRRLPSAEPWRLVDAREAGLNRLTALMHRTAVTVSGSSSVPKSIAQEEVQLPGDGRYISDTGEFEWSTSGRRMSVSGRDSHALIGYLAEAGNSYRLGPFSVEGISSLQGWAGLFLSRITGDGDSSRYLLSALGLVQNQGQTWHHYPSHQSAGFPPPHNTDLTLGSWGSEAVVAEGIGAEISSPFPPDLVKVYVLTPAGDRGPAVPVVSDGAGSRFSLAEEHRTLWYEVEITGGPQRTFVPGYRFGSQDFVGIALSNLSGAATHSEVSAHPSSQPGLAEYRDLEIPSGSQFAALLPEVFQPGAPPPQEGWLEILSDSSRVSSFVQFGDYGLHYLDGMTAIRASGGPLHLTRISDGPAHFRGLPAETRLSIANPGPDDAVVELIVWEQGTRTGPLGILEEVLRTEIPLRAGGSLQESIRILTGKALEEGVVELRLKSGGMIAAAASTFLPGPGSLFTQVARSAVERPFAYSPQLAIFPGSLFTSIRLVNRSSLPRTAILRTLADDGIFLGEPAVVELPVNSVFTRDADQLFPQLTQASLGFVGSLAVQITPPGGVTGDVVFGLSGTEYLAASDLWTSSFRSAVFSHVANLPGAFFTGLAIQNPSSDRRQVHISVFAAQGALAGEAFLTLEGRSRRSDVLSSLVPETARQTGGYILLQADAPILAQELFGTSRTTLLSAVPPRILEP